MDIKSGGQGAVIPNNKNDSLGSKSFERPDLVSRCTEIMIKGVENPPQELIDEKIAKLEECIRRFKSQRNQFALVSRLPPEVLSIIFSYVAAQPGPDYPVPCLLNRYSFSHVSQTWRSVALNAPTLWHVLPFSIPWAEVMIERSKAVSLVIRLHLSYLAPNSHRILFWKNVLRNHASRIQVLELTGSSKSTFSVLFNDLQPLSLSLHSLHLSLAPSEAPFTFPANIVETRNIRSLSISGCDGTWYSTSLSCLTELNMQNILNRPRFDEFFDILRRNPFLQTLDMRNSLPLASEFIGWITSVDLPRLRSLRLSTKNIKEISNILSRIIVPLTATLTLDCSNKNSVEDDQGALTHLASSLSVFFAAMPANSDVYYADVGVCTEMGSLRLKAWEASRGTRSKLRHGTPKLNLTIEPKTIWSSQTVLKEIFPSLPLLNITNLTLEMDHADALMRGTLSNLSQLRNVTTVGNCVFDLISALTHKPHNYYKEASAFYSVSFPTLRSLCIRGSECGPDGIDLLRDCLIERYERKAELTKLKLEECYEVYFDDVELLKEIVVDVEWDGWEREKSEPSVDSEAGYDCYEYDYYDEYDFDLDSDFYPPPF